MPSLGDQDAYNEVHEQMKKRVRNGRPIESSMGRQDHATGNLLITITYGDDLKPHSETLHFHPTVDHRGPKRKRSPRKPKTPKE
jgi:hypothetical protein